MGRVQTERGTLGFGTESKGRKPLFPEAARAQVTAAQGPPPGQGKAIFCPGLSQAVSTGMQIGLPDLLSFLRQEGGGGSPAGFPG